MNSDKQKRFGQRGNALIYVLLALALLGGLTMLLAKQGGESDDLSYETNELLVTKTVAFAAAAKNSVDQMMMSGTQIGNLIYLKPGETDYDTPPNYNKVFHTEGGGITLPAPDPSVFAQTDTAPEAGWYMGRFNNIEWTPSAAQDILFVAYDINQALCAALNRKITGESDIPVVTGGSTESFFVDTSYGGGANSDFTVANCAACEGFPSLCVASSGGTFYTYYNIISAQ